LQAALNDSGLKPVAFTLHDPHRKFSSAVVIGSFNKWQSRGFEMTYDESQQTWVLEHALPAGDYQYVFLIDGESSMPDPRAVFYIQDSFGNKNSLLQVGGVQHAL
jgi:1,4-alpha-glucan branching enzyme